MTHTKALTAAVAVLLLTAPGRANAQALPNNPQVAVVDGDAKLRAFRERVLLDTLIAWEEVPGKPPAVYARVRQILDGLKVPYTQTDSAHGLLWNEGFVARSGRLAGKPVSTFLRCGFGPSGDYADIWRVNVAYLVSVKASQTGDTKLGVALTAQAKDMAGAASPSVFCASKGRFEADIMQLVRQTAR